MLRLSLSCRAAQLTAGHRPGQGIEQGRAKPRADLGQVQNKTRHRAGQGQGQSRADPGAEQGRAKPRAGQGQIGQAQGTEQA